MLYEEMFQEWVDEWIDEMKIDPNWGKFKGPCPITYRAKTVSQFGYQVRQLSDLVPHYRIYRPRANRTIVSYSFSRAMVHEEMFQQWVDEWIDDLKADPSWRPSKGSYRIYRANTSSQFGYQVRQLGDVVSHCRIYRPDANRTSVSYSSR